jgi:hypothetical protein
MLEMVRQRIYGILADYEDQNDHDTLRSDPVFKLLTDRLPDGADLASQPTLSRLENNVTPDDLFRLRDVLVDLFIQSFETPPRHLTFDLDAFDDPAHGQQQLTFFHGYYEQYQYQPRLITCAQNDLVVMACLLYGTAHAALGADEDLEYLVRRVRAKWPDVVIELRGDSGIAVPTMYEICWPKPSSNTNRRASHSGCSQRFGIRPSRGRCRGGSSSRPKRMPQAPIAGRWLPIGRADACCRRRPTTNTPSAVKARTAIRRSSAEWKLIAGAIIATWPTCFACTSTRQR